MIMSTIQNINSKTTKSGFDKKGSFCHTTFASLRKTQIIHR